MKKIVSLIIVVAILLGVLFALVNPKPVQAEDWQVLWGSMCWSGVIDNDYIDQSITKTCYKVDAVTVKWQATCPAPYWIRERILGNGHPYLSCVFTSDS